MSRRLARKRILVTAAGAGIGRAVAIAAASEGATVIATSRTLDPMLDLDAYGVAEVRVLDVTSERDVEQAFEGTEPFDAVVHCAGVVHRDTLLDVERANLVYAFEVNVLGAFAVARGALPGMIARGGGAIVLVASAVSSLKAARNRCSYATTKAALIGLTRSVALDYADRGVRCNAICPGTIETESLSARLAAAPDPEAERAEIVGRHPLGRLGRVEEVADLAVYLCSDRGAFATGQAIAVDGGWAA